MDNIIGRFMAGIILIIGLSAVLIQAADRIRTPVAEDFPSHVPLGADTLLYHNFEDGMGGFTSVDETDDEVYWHLDTYNAYEGSGYSWWCGANPDEGWKAPPGYGNGWTQFLYSPILDFSRKIDGLNIKLSFFHKFDCEAPSGHPHYPDDWDGCCLFISTDGGTSFQAIHPTSNSDLTYNADDLWAFEYNNYGSGIPGWAGDSEEWVWAEFDLSGYTGCNEVQLRFTFASDGVVSDEDGYQGADFDGAWFIDNVTIKVAGFEQYFENFDDGLPHDWTVESSPPVGDHWVMTDHRHASPYTSMYCGNAGEWTLPQGLNNSLVSPPIDLIDAVDAYLDFRFWAGIPPTGDTLLDGVIIDVYGNKKYWENITGQAQGWNDDSQTWMRYCETGLTCDLTPWLGQVIKIQIWIESDYKDQQPLGEGIYVDDFLIMGEVISTDPLIDVEPDSFAISTYPDSLIEKTLVISNTGDGFLDYQLTEDAEWLSLFPVSGSVPGGETDSVTVTFDSSDLGVESYSTTIIVESNAENEPLIEIPVDMRVTGGIEIFLSPYETVLILGDTLRYDIEIVNNTDEVQGFDFATYVTLPDGTPYGPLVGPVTLGGLLPGWKITGYVEHKIPNFAPYGYYNYHAIAREEDIIIGKDRFEFIVNVAGHATGTESKMSGKTGRMTRGETLVTQMKGTRNLIEFEPTGDSPGAWKIVDIELKCIENRR